MVITCNVESGSMFCEQEQRILVGESPRSIHVRRQSPSKPFYTASTAVESPSSSSSMDSIVDSMIVKNNDREDNMSLNAIRLRTSTFDSQNHSLPSTSSEFDGKPGFIESSNSKRSTKRKSGCKTPKSKHEKEDDIELDLSDGYSVDDELIDDEELEEIEDESLMLSAEDARLAAVESRGDGAGPSGISQIEKRHKCDICGKAFPYMSILESHKRCHTGEKPFSCHFCDKKFAQKATLQVHERTHTGERPYKCKYCEKTFAQYGTKTVHEKSAHLGIRNYKCPKCSKCLSSPSALYTHKKTHGDKSFQCAFCPKQFTLKNYLKLHIKQVHEHGERKHVCKFCSKTFAYAGSLQVHVRTHTGERPYICKFCPKAFASQGNLQSHERTHTGERPYICRHCGRSFIQKSQLTAHEATHTFGDCESENLENVNDMNDSEECRNRINGVDIAEMNNNNFNFIDKHEADQSVDHDAISETAFCGAPPFEFPNEHETKPTTSPNRRDANSTSPDSQSLGQGKDRRQNEFMCRYCGKRYAYASSLYVHIRLHTGERPFRCNFCDKSFTNQGNMQVHLRVHTGEKPYKCEACGKSYAQKVGLKIHQEQCQTYLNRRGSVVTADSESGPPSTASLDMADGAVSDNERALIERILCEEKRISALPSEPEYVATTEQTAQQCMNGAALTQSSAAAIAQLLEIRNSANSQMQQIGTTPPQFDNSPKVDLNNSINSTFVCNPTLNVINSEANLLPSTTSISSSLSIDTNSLLNSSSLVSLHLLPSVTNSFTSSLSTSQQAHSALVNVVHPIMNATVSNSNIVSSSTAPTLTSTADMLLRQHTQQQAGGVPQQQQLIANLLLELEQQQILQQQQQHIQQLSTLLNLSAITNVNAQQSQPVIGTQQTPAYQLPTVDMTKLDQSQIATYIQPSASSLMISQPQPLYTSLPAQHTQLQQQHQTSQHDTQYFLNQILQLQRQQQQLVSIQQLLPSLNSNCGTTAADCNNNSAITVGNNNVNTAVLLNLIASANSTHVPATAAVADMTSPQITIEPYSQTTNYNYSSDGNGLNSGNNYSACKDLLYPPPASTVSYTTGDQINSESRNMVIAAAEALHSLSKSQRVVHSPTAVARS